MGDCNGGGCRDDDDALSFRTSAAPPPCLPQNAMIVRWRRLPHPVASSGRRREDNLNRGRYIFFDRDHAPRDIRNSAQDDRSLREDIFWVKSHVRARITARFVGRVTLCSSKAVSER